MHAGGQFDVHDQCNTSTQRNQELQQGWGDLVGRYRWDCFATLSYDPKKLRYGGTTGAKSPDRWRCRDHFVTWLMRWYRWQALSAGKLREVALMWGPGRPRLTWGWEADGGWDYRPAVRDAGAFQRWKREGKNQPIWVLGVEPFKSGGLHMHAVIRYPSVLPNWFRKMGWRMWFDWHGAARVEPPRDGGHVVQYVSKYVGKPSAELFVSENFNSLNWVK